MTCLMQVAWSLARARSRRALTFAAAVLSLATLRACFVEIADPAGGVPDGGGTAGSVGSGGVSASGGIGGASAGIGGVSVGGASGGGVGGVDGSGGCSGGCGAQCVSCAGGNAVRTCDEDAGACLITSCNDGFVDCNGDGSDGCEVNFGPFQEELAERNDADAGRVYLVSRLPGAPSVTNLESWGSVPLIPLDFACGQECRSGTDPGTLSGQVIQNPGDLPLASDFEAYFRIGWFNESVFVLGLAKDNEFVALDGGHATAQLQESLEVFLDSLDGLEPYQSKDHHVFIGLGSGEDDPQQGPPTLAELRVQRERKGFCFFIQAEFRAGSLEPTPNGGVRYGFSVGMNDWDTEEDAGGAARREHQVLWMSPGAEYGSKVVMFPRIELQP